MHDINPHPKWAHNSWRRVEYPQEPETWTCWGTFGQLTFGFPRCSHTLTLVLPDVSQISVHGSMVYLCSCHGHRIGFQDRTRLKPAAPPKFHHQNHLWHNSGQACSPTASSNLWCLGDAAKSLYLTLWHGEIFSPDPPIYNHLQSIFDTLWIFSDLFWRKPMVWAIFQLSDVSYQHLVQLLVATIADFGGAQRPSMQRRGNGSSLTRETWTKLLDMMFS